MKKPIPIIVGAVFISLIITTTLIMMTRPRQESPLVWEVTDPNNGLMLMDNFILDEERDIVVFAFELDVNARQKNLFTNNCERDYGKSCVFVVDSNNGSLKKAIKIDGFLDNTSREIYRYQDFIYLHTFFTAQRHEIDKERIIRINLNTFKQEPIWEKSDERIYNIEMQENLIAVETRGSNLFLQINDDNSVETVDPPEDFSFTTMLMATTTNASDGWTYYPSGTEIKGIAYFSRFHSWGKNGIFAIDLDDGTLVGEMTIKNSPNFWSQTTPVVQDGYIYTQSDSSGIYKFKIPTN